MALRQVEKKTFSSIFFAIFEDFSSWFESKALKKLSNIWQKKYLMLNLLQQSIPIFSSVLVPENLIGNTRSITIHYYLCIDHFIFVLFHKLFIFYFFREKTYILHPIPKQNLPLWSRAFVCVWNQKYKYVETKNVQNKDMRFLATSFLSSFVPCNTKIQKQPQGPLDSALKIKKVQFREVTKTIINF